MKTLFAPDKPRVVVTPTGYKSPFALRDYQAEDVQATLDAWDSGKRGVLNCWATGIGKSIYFAELSRRVTEGRVMVVVDTTKLAQDLYRTIIKHHGKTPGMLTGDLKSGWDNRRVVVATIQSLYAGKAGNETYRLIDPTEFSAFLIDETESALADQFGATVQYFMDGNPALKIAGASATPYRSDGREMGELFDHAAPKDPRGGHQIGTLNRNLKWGVMEGWLVKPRQGFLTCSVDFSTLKIRKQADGERDWSDKDITNLLMNQNEQQMREMAEGIVKLAKDRCSIVVCPNNVEMAKMIAGHVCGAAGDNNAAQAIYGSQGEHGRDLIEAHKRGEFQFAVSVRMLEKGYDNDRVVYAFMLRKTRSRRLYEQIMGRTTRPLVGIRQALQDAPDAEARRKIIEASDKPFSAMVDLVGVHPDAKDMGVIDIIGNYLPEAMRRRTMELMMRKDREAPEPGTFEDDDRGGTLDVGEMAREAKAQLAEEKKREEERERKRRSLVQVGSSKIDVRWDGENGAMIREVFQHRGTATDRQVNLMIALGVSPDKALKMHKMKASKTIEMYKKFGKAPDWKRSNKVQRESGIRLDTRPSAR